MEKLSAVMLFLWLKKQIKDRVNGARAMALEINDGRKRKIWPCVLFAVNKNIHGRNCTNIDNAYWEMIKYKK